MLTLITATPGSGKTLKALSLIFNYLNDGRNVWTNIDGINISGVRIFEDDIENPFDWRKLDNGSVVIYDEAQKHPAFSKRDLLKKYPKEKAEDIADIAWNLDYHRHGGYDVVLITQSPKLLNQHTLDFVGEHLHLRRIFGAKQATIFHFPEYKLNPNTRSVREEAINKETFVFPKHLYKFYKSATEHTHKTKIPVKFFIILIIVFIGIPALIYPKYKNSTVLNSDNVVQHEDQPFKSETKLGPEPARYNHPKLTGDQDQYEVSRIAMVIESSSDCYAKNSYGEVVDISIDECRALSNKNSRMSFARTKKESSANDESLASSNNGVEFKPPVYPSI